MAKITIKQIINSCNIPAGLIRAVIRQSGGFESFKESAQDVCNVGADAGYGGWIYYTETCAFTACQRQNILEMLRDYSDQFGEDMWTMVGNFNCLKISGQEAAEGFYNHHSEYRQQVYNALAWFALEEVCRVYCDMLEQN